MVVFSSIFLYFYMMSNSIEARLDVITQVEKQLIEIVQDDNREAKAIDVIETIVIHKT